MSSLSAPIGSVAATFLAPVLELLADCVHTRVCPAFPDQAWIHLGLQRVLHELPSGRAFLQQHAFNLSHCPPRANYFESMKSSRRLGLVDELNQRVCQRLVATLSDDLSAYPELADFDLYAGDGHWHAAAAHDAPIDGTSTRSAISTPWICGVPEWDRSDPVNAGIQKVELVSGAAGVLVRPIGYREPVSGTGYVFLTNDLRLRPGLIAFLYKLRWDVEKVFDELKNKLGEQQAWASSPIAKAAQAQLICLLHNLLVLLDARLKAEGIENEAEKRRKRETFAKAQKLATAAGRKIPSPVVALQRFTQHSVKLLRWLPVQFRRPACLGRRHATPQGLICHALVPILGHRSTKGVRGRSQLWDELRESHSFFPYPGFSNRHLGLV